MLWRWHEICSDCPVVQIASNQIRQVIMKRSLLIPVALAALLVGSAHAADYWKLKYNGVSGANVTIRHIDWGTTKNVTAGLFNMVSLNELTKPGFDTFAQGKTFFTFCTDIGAIIQGTWDYDPMSFNDAHPGVDPDWRTGGIQDAAWLFNQIALPQGTFSTTQAAAMQLAIWKVLYDELDEDLDYYGLTSSTGGQNFWAPGLSAGIRDQAVIYLDQLASAGGSPQYATTWLSPKNDGSQGLIYPPTGLLPVPDGGLTVLLLGLSCLGLGMARRKHLS